jgi:hypothetical protein
VEAIFLPPIALAPVSDITPVITVPAISLFAVVVSHHSLPHATYNHLLTTDNHYPL